MNEPLEDVRGVHVYNYASRFCYFPLFEYDENLIVFSDGHGSICVDGFLTTGGSPTDSVWSMGE